MHMLLRDAQRLYKDKEKGRGWPLYVKFIDLLFLQWLVARWWSVSVKWNINHDLYVACDKQVDWIRWLLLNVILFFTLYLII